jgi:hypothetical protein
MQHQSQSPSLPKRTIEPKLTRSRRYCVVFRSHFFCGEEPSSKCYGRTAALRLIVQPWDADDDDYDDDNFVFHFFK